MRRYRELIIATLFLLASVAAWQQSQIALQPTPDFSPVGVWQQYVIDGTQLVYLGSFQVALEDGAYQVEGLDTSVCAYPKEDLRVFGHEWDGQHWSYYSDWHEFGIARFELERIEENRFEGWAYLDGQRRPHRHVFFRIR